MKAENIAANLKNLRKENNLTQEDLADSLNVSRQTINALETGKYLPSIILALQIANFFELEFDDIFCENISLIDKRKEADMPKDMSPWSPFREVNSLHDAIDKAFDDAFFTKQSPLALPQINVSTKGNSVVVEAEIPGVDEDNLDIEIGETAIRISGEKKDEKEVDEKDYYHKEVSYGSFQRVIPLPCEVKHEGADAEVKDGVLKIIIPKMLEKKIKTIKVKARKVSKKK
ncbi:Hsp20 family protein [Patescibacteria group bacterium]